MSEEDLSYYDVRLPVLVDHVNQCVLVVPPDQSSHSVRLETCVLIGKVQGGDIEEEEQQ